MSDAKLRCPKCDAEMVSGHLLDRFFLERAAKTVQWVEGERVPSFTGVQPGGEGQLEVDAYRCTECGFVELYAG